MNSEQWNPGRLMAVSSAYWQGFTIHAGVKLGIFSRIAGRRIDGRGLAGELDTDPDATIRLLDALTAMGLMAKQGHEYTNTAEGLRFLSTDSKEYMGHILMHHHQLAPAWHQMEAAVRTGRPVRGRASFDDPEAREHFLMGMFNIASVLAPRVAAELDLSQSEHLLDLGGGPGTYAIYFCRQNPNLKATVFDLPSTEPFARKTIAKFGLEKRIQFQAGSYLENDIPGSFDAVWMSHILHGEGPEDCQRIVDRASAALAPGGMMAVHDFILEDSLDAPLFPALFSLNMLLGTERGRTYSGMQLKAMLKTAGIRKLRRLSFQTPNDSGIVMGVKPDHE